MGSSRSTNDKPVYGFWDVHSHILPGLDDGAADMDMSIRMLRHAWEEGISGIVLTPHYKPMRENPKVGTIEKALQELKERASENGIPMELYLGNEIYYSSEVSFALKEGKALTLAGTSWVLVEFAPMEDFAYIRDAVYSLLSEGFHPILAHVERYARLMEKKDRVEELLARGCYLQANASSVTGDNGWKCRGDVKWLLKRGYIHFVATDAHDDRGRAPNLKEAARYLEKRFGAGYARKVLYENADVILHNGSI